MKNRCFFPVPHRNHETGASRPPTRIREEIEEKWKWNLEDIYDGWDAWEAGVLETEKLMEQYKALKGTLAEGPQSILRACLLSDDLGRMAYRVYRYPGLKLSEDTRNNDVKARLGRVKNLFSCFRKATAWYTPELLKIPRDRMLRWFEEEPRLAPYRFSILESYRMQEHVLDADGEKILALAEPFGQTPAETYSMLADADVEFPSVVLSSGEEIPASHANYHNGLHTFRKQEDREALFRAHFSVFDRMPNTWAGMYDAVLQRDWFFAQARKYPSSLAADLDGDAIDPGLVDRLIERARNGADPLQRYHRIRKRTLGVEKYRYFDAYLPLVEVDWVFPYREAVSSVIDSVAIFGLDYQDMVRRAFDQRWIDVYENEGKRSGAFSAGVYGVHPYMLLNYADTLNDAFTVAHEMGHSMHTVLSHASQPFSTAEYSIFVAEVASMTNENLLMDTLLERETDPLRRVVLLQHAIDDIAAGFYRQALFADFELRAHREVEAGTPITAVRLQEIYLACLEDFFGSSLDDQDLYRNTWARIPHFFASPFYVYQYATSKAAAAMIHARLVSRIPDESRRQVETYLELLRSGGKDHPMNLLRRAGVDFSTSEPVEALIRMMDKLVAELDEVLDQVPAAEGID